MARKRSIVFDWYRALRDSGLPRETQYVAWLLSTYANGENENAHPGEALLAQKAGATTRTIRAHLARLREAGFIERYVRGTTAEHRRWADVYRLTMPATGSEFPVVPADPWADAADHRKSGARPPEIERQDHRKQVSAQLPMASTHQSKASESSDPGSRASARAEHDLHYGDVWWDDEERVQIVEDALGAPFGPGEEPAVWAMVMDQYPLPRILNTLRAGRADPAA